MTEDHTDLPWTCSCGKSIETDHPYSWCDNCGEDLPPGVIYKLDNPFAKGSRARSAIKARPENDDNSIGANGPSESFREKLVFGLFVPFIPYAAMMTYLGWPILASPLPQDQASKIVYLAICFIPFLGLQTIFVFLSSGRKDALWPLRYILYGLVSSGLAFMFIVLRACAELRDFRT